MLLTMFSASLVQMAILSPLMRMLMTAPHIWSVSSSKASPIRHSICIDRQTMSSDSLLTWHGHKNEQMAHCSSINHGQAHTCLELINRRRMTRPGPLSLGTQHGEVKDISHLPQHHLNTQIASSSYTKPLEFHYGLCSLGLMTHANGDWYKTQMLVTAVVPCKPSRAEVRRHQNTISCTSDHQNRSPIFKCDWIGMTSY